LGFSVRKKENPKKLEENAFGPSPFLREGMQPWIR